MQSLLSRVAPAHDSGRLSIAQWEALNARVPDDLEEIAEFDCDDE
ncbi:MULTISPECIES: hypothetical protein [Burkholderia cepacia complex]|nr:MULTISPECIES: hypothetical protein [Burkholderia cepacia complex]CAG9194852.1 hypothetical protein BVI2075_200059 [Burkholderia vietnamiensis]